MKIAVSPISPSAEKRRFFRNEVREFSMRGIRIPFIFTKSRHVLQFALKDSMGVASDIENVMYLISLKLISKSSYYVITFQIYLCGNIVTNVL